MEEASLPLLHRLGSWGRSQPPRVPRGACRALRSCSGSRRPRLAYTPLLHSLQRSAETTLTQLDSDDRPQWVSRCELLALKLDQTDLSETNLITGLVSGLSQRLVGSRTVLERGPGDLSDLPSELFIDSPALLTTLQLRSTQPCPMPWAAPGLELDCRARSSFLKKLCSVSLVACCLSRK